MEKIHEIKSVVHQLPDKKRYAELITAVLSVPVLITVLLLNLNNLRKPNQSVPSTAGIVQSTSPTSTPSISPKTTIKVTAKTTIPDPTPTSFITQGPCIKEVGPVTIISPEENEIVTTNPVAIDIERKEKNYCEIVWSYRINGDTWSDYVDKSIFLYNLSPGQKKIEIKVKSIASSNQIVLTRTFNVVDKITPTPVATSSAAIQN